MDNSLPLCWMIEHASATGRSDIVDLLFEEFTAKDWSALPEAAVPFKNAKGRFIVRTLIENISQQKYPKLIREYEMFAHLLRVYGSSGSLGETVKIVVSIQQQTYMYYINRIRELGDANVSAYRHRFKKVLRYHKKMKERCEARKRMFQEQNSDEQPNIEAKINLAEEKLIKKMDGFIDSYDPEVEDSDKVLDKWCKKYSCENFKSKIIKFLESINEQMPMTVMEYFTSIWQQRYSIEKNGLSRSELSKQYPRDEINKIYDLSNKDVKKFLQENQMEAYFPLSTNESPSQSNPSRNVSPQATQTPPEAQIETLEFDLHSPSPQREKDVQRPLPDREQSRTPPKATSPKVSYNDPLHDLLEMSSPDSEDAPLSQIPSQPEPATPAIASELRESINDLARMRGTDPLNRAQEESRIAKKRSRPISATPPARKVARSSNEAPTLGWDSDTDEDIPEPEFREPQPVSELQQVTGLPEAPVIRQPSSNRRPNPNGPVGRKGRWTDEEVDNLVEGLRLFGVGKWKSILNHFDFGGRTGVNLKDKYRNLLRYYTKEELLSGITKKEQHNE